MKLEQNSTSSQPAILHLLGRSPRSCLITQLSSTDLSVTFDPPPENQGPGKGDLAELHIESANSPLDTIKIKATVESTSHNRAQLCFLNTEDANVRQLVSWFGQTTSSFSSAPSDENAIIRELTEISLRQISNLMDICLDQTDSRLLNLAKIATSNDQQNKLFEIKSQLRQHGEKIIQLSCQFLQAKVESNEQPSTVNQPKETSSDPETSDTEILELIDLEEFEDWLSLEVIIRRANETYYKPLVCLEKRYSKLLHREVHGENLPFGIYNICHALQDAFKNFNIVPELLPIVYRFFDETVINQLDDLYDTLNSKLKGYGILPNVESQILHERRQSSTSCTNASDVSMSSPDISDEANNSVIPLRANPKLYSTVKDILGLLKNQPSEQALAPELVNPQQLIDALSSLQHNPEAIAEGETLHNWLNTNANINLSGETADLINLVEAIFQQIDNYPQISSELISQLKRLEVPTVKMALIDTTFFSSPKHPAKLLLNQLIPMAGT